MTTRLLLISDTHIPGRARALPSALLRAAAAADLIIHAGDWVAASVLDELTDHGEVLGVFGNNELLRRMPSMTLVSGRVGVRRGDLDLSLFVNNLFDTDRRNYRYHYSGVDDILLSQTVRPRTVGVTLTWAR